MKDADLITTLRSIQDADTCLLSGNGGPTRGQIYQAREHLRKAVLQIQAEVDARAVEAGSQ